jgi:Putative peptidoglycan binding domain
MLGITVRDTGRTGCRELAAHVQPRQLDAGRGVPQSWRFRGQQMRRDHVWIEKKEPRLRPYRDVSGWLVAVWLTGCVASQTGGPTGLQPATDELFTAGDIQVAQEHLRAFGFDPGPVKGVFTAETQAAVRAYQARYGLPVTGLLDRVTRLELLPGFDQRPKL